MIKYRFFQVIMAIAVIMLIISSAVFVSFYGIKFDEERYISEITSIEETEDNEEMTGFEAWLEYSIIAEGLTESGNDITFDEGNVKLCDYNLNRLDELKRVRDEAKRMIFLSLILLVIGFLAVKKRRMYECVVWGGVGASVIGIISLLLLAVSRSGIFYGIREMVFNGKYDVFFSDEDLLISLIPGSLAIKMFIIYAAVILVGLVITIVVRIISWKKTRPHKF